MAKDMEDKIALKKKIHEKCLSTLEHSAETTRKRIEELQEDANMTEEEHDVFDGTRNKLLSQRDIYAGQLQNIINEIQVVNNVNSGKLQDKVDFGAVVKTNKQNLFIVTGLGKIEVDGEQYFVISRDVPIYKVMEGKKKGDTFEFNNNKFEIKDVF
ncbi:MAG: hypothetical protein ACLFPH_07330 [Bacteroidales bacterium]